MSIQVIGGYKWGKDRVKLQKIMDDHPGCVGIDYGKVMSNGESFSGYVEDIPYGEVVMVKYLGKSFAFKKRTDGKTEVF
jgi:hypothetical protein